ncbi:MAG: 6-carboxytetrahydropterin synthase, partial [Bacteroidales bacterium]|nr:6-carboxytetrahydropterin synthase [Bacteroidales bacterium]
MYYISKRLEVAGAHCLALNYDSKCSYLHGHNWFITVYCKSEKLNENGMVVD